MNYQYKVALSFIGIIVLLFNYFNYYKSTHVMSSEVCFEVYLDSKVDIDAFFGLAKNTYDEKKHKIICQYPVKISGFKTNSTIVKQHVKEIDCEQDYDEKTHLKYEAYEINGNEFKLILANKHVDEILLSYPALLSNSQNILATQSFNFNYKKGKINRIIITNDGILEYCEIDS